MTISAKINSHDASNKNYIYKKWMIKFMLHIFYIKTVSERQKIYRYKIYYGHL